MKLNLLSLTFFLAAAFLITACQKDNFLLGPGDEGLDMRVNCDPCEGDIIFGPDTYVRTIGKPFTVHRIFNMGEDVDVCLTVVNEGISSAWISIDGVEVFSPKDFNKNVTALQVTTFLYAGPHEIAVKMQGPPGGSITLMLRGCITQPPPPLLCSEEAIYQCEAKLWQVVGVYPSEGTVVCTVDGRLPSENCDTCSTYNIFVWKDHAPEHFCAPQDVGFVYSTLAGELYAGHEPCDCGEDLEGCGSWDMRGCIPD